MSDSEGQYDDEDDSENEDEDDTENEDDDERDSSPDQYAFRLPRGARLELSEALF